MRQIARAVVPVLGAVLMAMGAGAALAPAVALAAAPEAEASASAAVAKADALLQAYTPDKPGLQVVVARGGRVIYERNLGSADLEHGVPVTADTRFHVASVSKQFTAFAALQLIRAGKIDPDADIHAYLPELADYGEKITVADLAHHVSGIRDQWELVILAGTSIDSLITQKAILAMAASQKGLNFPPRTDMKYSNLGYSLLAEIVARQSGTSFRTYVQDHIFKPLGMDETFVYDDASELVRDRAMSYALSAKGVELARLNYSNYGATSLHTTARDLLKWSRETLHPAVFDPALFAAQKELGQLRDGRRTNYAWGVMLEPVAGRETIAHAGGDAGYRSYVASFPRSDGSIVVLSNGGADTPKLTAALADIFLPAEGASPPAPAPVPPSAEQLAKLPGLYVNEWSPSVELTARDGKIYAAAHTARGVGAHEAHFLPDGRFYLADPASAFQVRPDGAIIERQGVGGLPFVRVRALPARPTPAELAALGGAYHSDELDVTYVLKPTAEGLTMVSLRSPPIDLLPAEADAFESPRIRLGVIRGPSGEVTGVRLSTGRLRDIRFMKTSSGWR